MVAVDRGYAADTHDSFDYRIGDARVICNPRGYGGENRDFNPALVIEA